MTILKLIDRLKTRVLTFLELRSMDKHRSMLRARFQSLRFDSLKPEEIDRIVHSLESMKSLNTLMIDPIVRSRICAEFHLCRESAAFQLLLRGLDGTPLLQLEGDGSIKVQIHGVLLATLEKYVHH